MENKKSGADIGLVYRYSHLSIVEETAILLQAKRLDSRRETYSLESRYAACNDRQTKLLQQAAPNCAGQFLLYNPELSRFTDPLEIRDREKKIADIGYSHCHNPLSDAFLSTCPGIRVMGTNFFPNGKPTLEQCYSAATSQAEMLTFADFMVDRVMNRQYGSSDPKVVSIAKGETRGRISPAYTLTVRINSV